MTAGVGETAKSGPAGPGGSRLCPVRLPVAWASTSFRTTQRGLHLIALKRPLVGIPEWAIAVPDDDAAATGYPGACCTET